MRFFYLQVTSLQSQFFSLFPWEKQGTILVQATWRDYIVTNSQDHNNKQSCELSISVFKRENTRKYIKRKHKVVFLVFRVKWM